MFNVCYPLTIPYGLMLVESIALVNELCNELRTETATIRDSMRILIKRQDGRQPHGNQVIRDLRTTH